MDDYNGVEAVLLPAATDKQITRAASHKLRGMRQSTFPADDNRASYTQPAERIEDCPHASESERNSVTFSTKIHQHEDTLVDTVNFGHEMDQDSESSFGNLTNVDNPL